MPAIALSVRDEAEYAYSVARVRVLETKLLSRSTTERLVEADSVEEAFRILAETEYSEVLSAAGNSTDFESVLALELKRVYEYVRRFSPDPALLDVLALRFDLHNLKVLLKEKYLGGARFPAAMMGGGSLDVDAAREAVFSGTYSKLPEDYATVVERAARSLEETGDPQVIDLVIDGEMFRLGLRIAIASRFELLKEIWTTLIDMTNIKAVARVNRLDGSREFLSRCLIEGGSVGVNVLLGLHGQPPGAVVEALRYTRYSRLAEEGLWEGSRFELLADDFMMSFLKGARHKAFGPEPIIAYVLAKETEIRNLRVIFTGKVNGLPAGAIRERLRETYV
ncbi:MAG: V-type ATP synthase subunit C [Firmicutes bacterium]|nr:V-type ATP synthase subunit C [Bacillota bacterium]